MKNLAIGVDVGGTHVTTAVINLDDNTVLKNTISGRDVNNCAEAKEIIKLWAEAISESISKSPSDIKGVGIAIPGPFDYEKGISEMEHKFEKIKGINLSDFIKKELNIDVPIRYINDASAFAVGEAYTYGQKKYKRILAITLGTGFGSAFIDEGMPIVERSDVPKLGCVWHLKYKDGIADDYFSTRWFVNKYESKTGEKLKGVKQIAERYDADNSAKEVFTEFGINLAEFLSPWLKNFSTESLIIGGNISKAYNLISPSFENELKKQGISLTIDVSKLKEEAALVGSARLLDSKYYEIIKASLAMM